MIDTFFLPGASGNASFWKPVATQLKCEGHFFAWPGLGVEPPDKDVRSIEDLVRLVAREIHGPVDIVAQSMGGYIALKLALEFPHLVKRLVLAVTSGGVPVGSLGSSDWRSDYFSAFPQAARWIAEPVTDLSAQLPSIQCPSLLLWGDADPISPVAVGERLAALLPNAHLSVLPDADHDLAQTHVDVVAERIRHHLTAAR